MRRCRRSAPTSLPLPTGIPHDYRKAFAPRLGHRVVAGPDRGSGDPRRHRPVLQRSGAERLGRCAHGGQYAISLPAVQRAGRSGMPAGSFGRRSGCHHRSQLSHSLHPRRERRRAVRLQSQLDDQRRLHPSDRRCTPIGATNTPPAHVVLAAVLPGSAGRRWTTCRTSRSSSPTTVRVTTRCCCTCRETSPSAST